MKDFHSRKKNTTPLLHRSFVAIALLFLVIILMRSVYTSYLKKKNAALELEKINTYYEILLKKKNNLQEKIHRLKTKGGIIEEYKKRFDLVEPGEYIIRIVE